MIDFTAILQIIVLNLILSGDNAVVIAMATLRLPPKQRQKAVYLGISLAVILRIALTAVAAYLLSIPHLQTIGGVLLIWIALRLLKGDTDSGVSKKEVNGLRGAVGTIIFADLLMSLDNVLAVAGASGGNLVLLIVGLVLSIPIVIWGSDLIATLMRKLPWVVYIGAGLIGWTAGEMITVEPLLKQFEPHYLISVIIALGVVLLGRLLYKEESPMKHNS